MNAGRILIMPKGNYDESAQYEMLDLVYYNGASWIAKKTVSGIAPSESEYWQKIAESGVTVRYWDRTVNCYSQTSTKYSIDVSAVDGYSIIGCVHTLYGGSGLATLYQTGKYEGEIYANEEGDFTVRAMAIYTYNKEV